jgi:hypothetical protein
MEVQNWTFQDNELTADKIKLITVYEWSNFLKAVVPTLSTDTGMNVFSFPDGVKYMVFMTCVFGDFVLFVW